MCAKRLTATMVVDLQDRTGRSTQAVIGNLNRLQRAERDLNLARNNVRLGRQDRAMERLMMEREADLEQRRARYRKWMGIGVSGALVAGVAGARAVKAYASVERQMNRIGITAGASAEQVKDAFATLQQQAKNVALPLDAGIEALDTLVSSGLDLKQAMSFLPSVLATAQATGAATSDIANTALKASSALKIQSKDMQHAFDVMVVGANEGQFELDDMSQYIPALANSFATLGYTGVDGLKQLVAILQTLRERTSDAGSAATQAQNIFGKMYSQETINKFSKFGIDLRREMKQATDSGENAVDAFVRITQKALNGDMTKLPLLFNDQEFRLGMQSLLGGLQSVDKYLKSMSRSDVGGTVGRQLNRILDDTQAKVDRLQASWDRMWNSGGAAASDAASPVMDAIADDLDYGTAIRQALKKKGYGLAAREAWIAAQLPFGPFSSSAEADKAAYEGGYRDPKFLDRYWLDHYSNNRGKSSYGRQNQRVVLPEFPGGDRNLNARNLPLHDVPVPGQRPGPETRGPRYNKGMTGRGLPTPAVTAPDVGANGMNVFAGFEERISGAARAGADRLAEGVGRGGDVAADRMRANAIAIGQAIGNAAAAEFNRNAKAPAATGRTGPTTGQVLRTQMDGQAVDPH